MKQLCCIESSDVLSANPISMVHHPKSDEKNVGIPSKSPWKSSICLVKELRKLSDLFCFGLSSKLFHHSCDASQFSHTKSHWKMFPPQKLTIFNEIGREHP